MIGRRAFLAGAAGAAVLPPLLRVEPAGAMTGAPKHMLLVVFDDAEWPDFGFTTPIGDIDTPHLDALRAGGAFLTNFYTSNAGCTPTRYSLVTGSHPMRYGVTGAENDNVEMSAKRSTGNGVGPDTVAATMRGLGYATGIIGKWHVGLTHRDLWPGEVGFDFAAVKVAGKNVGRIELLHADGTTTTHDTDYSDDLYADEAIGFVTANESTYLSMNFHSPHVSWEMDDYANPNDYDLTTPRGQKQAAMQRTDAQLGRILAAYPNPAEVLVLVTSDNGAPDEERNPGAQGPGDIHRGYKTNLFEGGINMPCVVSWPGTVKPGSTFAEPVTSYDLGATLAAIAGGSHDGALAEDRSAALLTGAQSPRGTWYSEGKTSINSRPGETRHFAIFDWPMKYVQGDEDDPVWELFDMSLDPSEQRPLSVSEADHVRWMVLLHEMRDRASRNSLGPWAVESDPNTRPWTLRVRLSGAEETPIRRSGHIIVRSNERRVRIILAGRNAEGDRVERTSVQRIDGPSELWISTSGFKRGYPYISIYLDGSLVDEITDLYGMWSERTAWQIEGDVTRWSCEFRAEEFALLA